MKICNYEFIPNAKKIGKIIHDQRNKASNKKTADELSTELLTDYKTVYGWESGKSMPSLDILYNLAEIFQIPLDDLLLPDSKFKGEKSFPETGVLSLNEFSYFWYLTEKSVFSFLSFYEAKHYELDFSRYIKTDDMPGDSCSDFFDKYSSELREKYSDKYKTSLSHRQAEEIMYDLRRRIKVYSSPDRNELYYERILGNSEINVGASDSLNDFDKMVIATAYNAVNRCSGENLFENATVWEPEEKIIADTVNEALNRIYELLIKTDYNKFISQIKPAG